MFLTNTPGEKTFFTGRASGRSGEINGLPGNHYAGQIMKIFSERGFEGAPIPSPSASCQTTGFPQDFRLLVFKVSMKMEREG